MAVKNGYDNSNSTPESNLQITDGQLNGINVRIQNPNFPYGGDVEDTDAVVGDWLDTNFPEISQDELSEAGIDVTYTSGGTEYYLYGKKVSEEEFQKELDACSGSDSVVTSGNQTKIIHTAGNEQNDTITNTEVGYRQQSPGVIKISVTDLDQLKGIDEEGNITKSTADNLNQITGSDVFTAGSSVYDTMVILKKDTGIKQLAAIGLIFASAFEEKLATKAGLVGKLDANDSKTLNTVNDLAKATTVIGGIAKILSYVSVVALGEEYATSKVLEALASTPLVSVLIDLIIDDRDEEFRVASEEEDLEIYSTQENKKCQSIFGNYTIHLNYEEPEKLYNNIVSYIESSKCHLVNKMVTLKDVTREDIIAKVRSDIILLAQTGVTESNTKALSEIMKIDHVSFDYDYICFVDNMFSKFNPNNDEKKYKYSVKRKLNISTMTYTIKRSKVDKGEYVEEINELNTAYTAKIDLESTLVYQSVQMPPQSIDSINSNFVKSYYKKYADEEEGGATKIQTSIGEVCADECVQTGEVDLWKGAHLFDRIDSDDVSYFQGTATNYVDEAQKNKTNFMSPKRIELAISMVEEVYDIYLTRLLKNIDIAEKTGKTEQDVISSWDKILGMKGKK